MMLSKEDLTVLITNYNYGVYLPACIESILEGEVVPGRIVVVDDGSIDNSLEIVKQYCEQVEIIINPENLGITNSYNRAIQKIETKWMFVLDADNIVSKDYVSEFLRASNEFDNSIVIVYTDMFLFGKEAEEMANRVNAVKYFEAEIDNFAYLWKFPNYRPSMKNSLATENFIHGNSFFRLDRYREVGGFDHVKPEDHNLWKRMLDKDSYFHAVKLSNAKLGYRQHSQTQTQKIVELKAIVSDLYLELFKLQDELEELRSRTTSKKIDGFTKLRVEKLILRLRILGKVRIGSPNVSKLEKRLWLKLGKIWKKYNN